MTTNNVAPIMGIDRLRMGTDGNGITSLVTFYGCPLKCVFCLNPQCHRSMDKAMYLKPVEVYKRVAVDELYYLATGGGITFGGGEPLLYSKFIIDVLKQGAKDWNTTIETSLNLPYKQFAILLPYVNELIVDIKDMNPNIYKSYTFSDNSYVLENLKTLSSNGFTKCILVRLPLIKGYNSNDDVLKSKKYLESLGYHNFDLFEYKTDLSYERERKM